MFLLSKTLISIFKLAYFLDTLVCVYLVGESEDRSLVSGLFAPFGKLFLQTHMQSHWQWLEV